MPRKSNYDQLLAAIDKARRSAPLDDPLPNRVPSSMTRPVYNANCTRCFEEDISSIHPGSNKGQWYGTVVDSLAGLRSNA